MNDPRLAAQAQAILEEELGEARVFQNMTAAEIEALALRLVRALGPVLGRIPEARRDAA